MSMNSALKERLERLGPVRDAARSRSYSAVMVPVSLSRAGVLDRPVDVARHLFDAGATMRAAHAALGRMAATGRAICDMPDDADLNALARDMALLGVRVARRRLIAEPAAFLAAVRARHDLSQREFADTLGLDVRTLQNWEQGRNRPDAATLNLVRLFDTNPDQVALAAFESVLPDPVSL